VIERAATVAGGLNRRTLAWGGVALAAITLLSINLIASTALREARFDLTAERLFSLSDGTRKVLRAIDEPIDLRVYFSRKLGEVAPTYAKSFQRARTMLDQYREIARGKLRIAYLDPEPFSDAEDRAVADGLKGVRLNREGEMGYFGIAGSNTTDGEANLPFINVERERFLEYDLTKLIVTLANQRKTTVGLISGIPLEGSPGNPMLGRPPSPGPLLIGTIREVFDVKTIARNAKEIPAGIGVLMVVQPEGLSPETAYAIDQFALSGGKVLAMVDPLAEKSRQGNPMFMMSKGPPDLAEFGKLLKAWGVSFDTGKLAADRERATPVQWLDRTVVHYVLWLGFDRGNLNETDVLTGDIKLLSFLSAGSLEKAKDATTEFTPIVHTTKSGALVPAEAVSLMPDPVGLLKGYKPGGKPLVVAARLSGEAKTAYPGGRPQPPAKKEAKADTPDAAEAKAAGKSGEKAAPAGKTAAGKAPAPETADKKGAPAGDAGETKATESKAAGKKTDAAPAKTPQAPPAKPHVTAGKVNVVLVADTDFLHDEFWLQVSEFLGQQVLRETSHNATFVMAALENLTGSDALISLRGRGIADRPFKLVDDLRRHADQRFRQSEQALKDRLKEVQSKLATLKKGEGDALVLSERQRKEIERFEKDLLTVRRQLREVQRELRKDIDRLDGMLKFVNIAAVPLLIGLVGIGWTYRRRRSTAPSRAAETQQ
jgi:ABC-type uncharacterized transport system involved in gliding motility auxiliary subunit